MKIYMLTRIDDTFHYDAFDSCIVVAENADDAKMICPDDTKFNPKNDTWVDSLDYIACEEIGIANDKQVRGVILASFNAG